MASSASFHRASRTDSCHGSAVASSAADASSPPASPPMVMEKVEASTPASDGFAPFVAGIGRMKYARFAMFNVVGAIAWVVICACAGFFFGELPFVKKNFELVVLGIIFVSVLPIAVEMAKGFLESRRAKASATSA